MVLLFKKYQGIFLTEQTSYKMPNNSGKVNQNQEIPFVYTQNVNYILGLDTWLYAVNHTQYLFHSSMLTNYLSMFFER